MVQRALTAAELPSHLQPSSQAGSDGKRKDGGTMVPWSSAPSYKSIAVHGPGSIKAAEVKCAKYDALHHPTPSLL
uniref:Uncharacterized protein n=1 Tax=Amphimedon queenslandica TaxID=400682 RepID=A0A1X7TVI7_AMPQE